MLQLRDVSKQYGAVRAVDGVSLDVPAGKVHGLLGENGAGKSTLMHVLYGMTTPDRGVIAIADQQTNIANPAQARMLGIGMVHQHFMLVPTMTVLDNVILAVAQGLGRVDRETWARHLRDEATALGWQLDPNRRVDDLAIGEQQRVEIVKALLSLRFATGSGRVLILDEPTAVLTPGEVDELLPAITRLAEQGVAVLYITHKLAEIARVCDMVTVLRRGAVVYQGDADLPRERLAELMVGEATTAPRHKATPAQPKAIVHIAAHDVSLVQQGRTILDQINVEVRAGEIIGIAGVDGNGQTELIQVLLGLSKPTRGKVQLSADRADIAVIPDDRQREGMIADLSIQENLALKRYRREPWSTGRWLRLHTWTQLARTLTQSQDIALQDVHQPLADLSGGNQQKTVVARELADEPIIVIACNPTRGLDVAAAAKVLEQLLTARDRGAAVLLVHSDLDELLAISDRVFVAYRGRLLTTPWPACDRSYIGACMAGGMLS